VPTAHILPGTDFPFGQEIGLRYTLHGIRDCPCFTDEDRALVLDANARSGGTLREHRAAIMLRRRPGAAKGTKPRPARWPSPATRQLASHPRRAVQVCSSDRHRCPRSSTRPLQAHSYLLRQPRGHPVDDQTLGASGRRRPEIIRAVMRG